MVKPNEVMARVKKTVQMFALSTINALGKRMVQKFGEEGLRNTCWANWVGDSKFLPILL